MLICIRINDLVIARYKDCLDNSFRPKAIHKYKHTYMQVYI